jgi:hypothetical protein
MRLCCSFQKNQKPQMKKQFKAAKNKQLGVHLPSASSCPTLGQSLSLMFYNTLRGEGGGTEPAECGFGFKV